VKRSRHIRLILIGGISAGALAGCSPDGPSPVSSEAVYTNDYYIPGVGYYHAPFHDWYTVPYNHFDPQTQRFFYGGQWASAPMESAVNISSPTPEAVSRVEAARTDVTRGGFGGSSGGFFSSGS
jgi:hypothetical protein